MLESHPSLRDSRFYLSNFASSSPTPAPGTTTAPPASASTSSRSDPDDSIPSFPVSDSSTPTTAFPRALAPHVDFSFASPPQSPTLARSSAPAKAESKLADVKAEAAGTATPLANELRHPTNRHTALVKVQGPFTQRQLASIAEGMVYLRKLGLVSVILLDREDWWPELASRHRLSSSMDDAYDLASAPAGSSNDDALAKRREQMKRDTLALVEMLEAHGGAARPLLEGVLRVSSSTVAGESAEVRADALSGIRDAIRCGEIPVIPPIALDDSCFSRCLDANDAMAALAAGLARVPAPPPARAPAGAETIQQDEEDRWESDTRLRVDVDLTPLRLMIINREGGIPSHAREGNPHLSINLESEWDHVTRTFVWHESHPTALRNLDLIKRCLAVLPRTASAVVVSHRSPRALIANLITNKPAHSPSLHHSLLPRGGLAHTPTIVRRGLPIRVCRSMQEIDRAKLKALLERSFARKLDDEPYWARLERDLDFVILAGDYQGCAIVTNELAERERGRQGSRPIAYLDKFAVLPSLQGDGTVDFLWGALRDESFGLGAADALNPNVGGLQGKGVGRDLVWRSRTNNPVNKWYFERSNGFCRLAPPDAQGDQSKAIEDDERVQRTKLPGFTLFWCEAEDGVAAFRRARAEKEARERRSGHGATTHELAAEEEQLELDLPPPQSSHAELGRLARWASVIGAIPSCWHPL